MRMFTQHCWVHKTHWVRSFYNWWSISLCALPQHSCPLALNAVRHSRLFNKYRHMRIYSAIPGKNKIKNSMRVSPTNGQRVARKIHSVSYVCNVFPEQDSFWNCKWLTFGSLYIMTSNITDSLLCAWNITLASESWNL